MRANQEGNLILAAVLVVVLATAGVLVPMAWRNREAPSQASVQAVPAPATPVAPGAPVAPLDPRHAVPAPGTETDVAAASATEEVPAEESETDRGTSAVSPAGPNLSFGRAAGLHTTPDPLKLNSSAALVIDQGTGEVLARKNDQVVLPMASLTKLMTALVVAEAKQPMDEMLTITADDVDNERHSRSRLRVGSQLTRKEALHLALMSSENRAAHALGRTYPGGLTKMVEAMNSRAQQLGMKNTTYVDPTGLSNRNRSTARDLAVLVAEVGRHAELSNLSVDPDHVATLGQRSLQYRNSNRLVRNANSGWDIVLQKTGYIVEAGRCLTMVANVAGHKLIMVMLDAESNTARLADAQKLRRWVVAQNGWQDNTAVAQASAAEDKPRRSTATKKAGNEGKRNSAVAARDKGTKGGKAVAAGKKGDGRKEAAAKEGRVRQSFASGKDAAKS
jgi:D-alanyl-D-alanine endopeptidase (penicillin-binding protein 7)